MRKYAAFEKKTGRSAKSRKWRKTLAKHGILTHREALERYDKNPIRLPRQHMPCHRKASNHAGPRDYP